MSGNVKQMLNNFVVVITARFDRITCAAIKAMGKRQWRVLQVLSDYAAAGK